MDYSESVPVNGYEGKYSITRDGQLISHHGGGNHIKKLPICKGYYRPILWGKDKFYNKTIHRLVAEHFIPNPNNLPEVNHKDGNKLNNKVDNLEWCTAQQNRIHALSTGLASTARGMKDNSKLCDTSVIVIRDSFKAGFKQRKIAEYFKIGQAQVSRIVNKKRWEHL